jgi:hypothetical protein
MVGARDQLNKMKEDVKILPGDLGQLANIMKTIASPAAQSGAKADDIRKLAGKGMLYGMGLQGLDEGMVARELALMLSGRVGAHNVLAMRLGLSGSQAGSFKDMTPEKRLETINKALDTQIGGSADAFGKSWMAVTTTLKSNLKYGLLAPVTAPLFDAIKSDVTKLNQLFDANHDKIAHVTYLVGNKLVSAWHSVVNVVERVEPVFERIAGWVMSLDAEKLKLIGVHFGEAALLAELAPSGIRFGTKMLGAGLTASMGGEAAGAAAAALPAMAAAAGALAVVATGTAGAIDILSDSTNQYHDAAVRHLAEIKTNMEVTARTIETAWGDIKTAAQPAADAIGDAFLHMARNASQDISFVIGRAGAFLGLFGKEKTIDDEALRVAHAVNEGRMSAEEAQYWSHSHDRKPTGEWTSAGSWESLAKAHTFNQTNHITSSITISGAQDPSRVARMTKEAILNLAKHPTKSPYVTDHTLSVR